MATFNLLRNSRVFFTTNLGTGATAGQVNSSNFTTANSQEIQVLDNFTFSQTTNADTVTISEAGGTPVRGQRAFNTSLNPVEFSFSTYIRPYISTTVKAEEAVLWNALMGSVAIGATDASSVTSISAANLTGNTLSLTGTGFSGSMTAGEIVVIKGVTGAGASQFNNAVKIISNTTTSIVAEYATAPTAGIVLGNWTSAVKFVRTAWNEHIAQAGDTSGYTSAYSEVTTSQSNKNTLLPFGMVVTVDGVTYTIDNCVLDQAVIDFGLDGIATISWSGKGTALNQLATNVTYSSAGNPVLSGGLTGTITGKYTSAGFITNKLSTVSIKSNIAGISGTSYNLALTGGSITIANNTTYVTPALLGVVNKPIGYFTGTRSITGNVTAYLRTGSTNSSGLLSTLLTNSTTAAGVEPKYKLQVEIGGSSNTTRVEVQIDGAALQIPTVDAQAVMSTTINFTAQGTEAVQSATSGYDIENVNDLEIRYFAA